MQVKAVAKDTGISAQKLRLIANMVRGKKVEEALNILKFTPTPNAIAIAKVIKSAASNAENNYQLAPSDLRITRILVDKGPHLKRFRAKARGQAGPILKGSSHITVIVADQEG